MHQEAHKKLNISLKKISSLTIKIQSMVESEAGCVAIVQQLNALIGLSKNASLNMLKSHLQRCGRQALIEGDEKEQADFIDELVQVFSMITKK
jgi:DNA-binding FrmR family transcriptional regulator